LFCSWLCTMWFSMWLLRYEYEGFEFFHESLQVPWYCNFYWRPFWKKNFASLILTNLKLYVLNLVLKWYAKDPKKMQDHLIFMNFKVKKFSKKNIQKNKKFGVWTIYSCGSHGMVGYSLQEGNLEIPQLLPQILMLWFFEKKMSSTMLKAT
jgi:hypothetical protein